ncbi:MAG: response regulator [Bacteroidia bacterium]|nr:response regulator [Bacteroidia bacterium]
MTTFKKIILVEDDELDADMTKRTLLAIPLANPIVWLETGQEFLDYLDEHGTMDIALVILDLKMPLVSGLEALEILHNDTSKPRNFPVVVLTSTQNSPEVRRCYELGINAFVTKPVSRDQFGEAVNALGLFWGIHNVLPDQN